MRRKRILLILLVCFLLTSTVMAMSSTNYAIDWMVPLTGGGGPASSENYALNLTVGQTASRSSESASYQAGLGYWYGAGKTAWEVFLPLMLKH